MDPRPPLYDPLVRLLRAASPLAARGDSKLARGIRGRRQAGARLAAWAREHRDPARPLVWFHAPSVGEGLQARAVLEEVTRRRPHLQTVYTHFSPSAEGLAARMPADVADYLPWDDRRDVARVLDALRPQLIAFTKTEVWPGLAAEALARGVPMALLAGTLPAGSSRLRPPAARLLRKTFGALDRVMAVEQPDAQRFARLGVPYDRVDVCGDPAVDSAWQRVGEADLDTPYLRAVQAPGRFTLVAGSTWEPDEAVLLPALERLAQDMPRLQAVVAPHEPHPSHVTDLVERFTSMGWEARTLAELEAAEGDAGSTASAPQAVVVERVGVLAELYRAADAAYVGGGFHRHGLHSVLEPAAAGVPVVFGPRHGNAPAAGALSARGGAHVVGNADELHRVLSAWVWSEAARGVVAREVSGYIDGQRGAALRTAQALEWLLDSPHNPTRGPARS